MPGKAPGKPFIKGDKRAGRPKGRLNNATVEVRELARGLTTGNPEYMANLARALVDRTAPPGVETMVWAYAHGKPKETIELQGEAGGPITAIMRVIVDPRADASAED